MASAPVWSASEQALLEDALILFTTDVEPDLKKRWNAIAQHVGKTAKACVVRTKECAEEATKVKDEENEAAEREEAARRKFQEDRERELAENLRRLKKKEEGDLAAQQAAERAKKESAEEREKERILRAEEAVRMLAQAKQDKIDAERRKKQQEEHKVQWVRKARINEVEKRKKAKEDRMEKAAREAPGAIWTQKKPTGTEDRLDKAAREAPGAIWTQKKPTGTEAAAPSFPSRESFHSASSGEGGPPPRRRTNSTSTFEATCPLCADKADVWTVGPCNHRSMCCYCGMKMRLLLQDKRCMECQQESDDVLYTPDTKSPFSDYGICGKIATGRSHVVFDDIVDGFVEGTQNRERLRNLQCHRKCPLNCGYEGQDNLKALEYHLKTAHSRFYCRLCLEFRKVFIQQHRPYNQADLQKHIRKGDDGTKGHPQCTFCKKRFYSDTEYGKHLRQQHFWCHICEKLGRRDVFFGAKEEVTMHFEKFHFVCNDPECKKDTWVAFASMDELRAHNVDQHNKQEIVCLVNFSYQRNTDQNRGNIGVEIPTSSYMAPVLSREQDFPSLPGTSSSSRPKAPASSNRPPAIEEFPALGGSAPSSSTNAFPALGSTFSPAPRGGQPSRTVVASKLAQSTVKAKQVAPKPSSAASGVRSEPARTVVASKTVFAAKAPATQMPATEAPRPAASAPKTFQAQIQDFPSLPEPAPKPVQPSRHVSYTPKTWATTTPSTAAARTPEIQEIPKMKMTQKQKRKKEMQALAFKK
eukprot:GEMP01011973.1.p1 GENE.GEMP01011973.1~~GEMP01011973.1.p1  ORF type:complete len:778 (+),score=189.68 GEMP01011973.1:71-2335(+)